MDRIRGTPALCILLLVTVLRPNFCTADDEEERIMESSNWAELLDDVLLTIIEQLDISDLIRSSAVCASWCATSTAVRRARFPLPSSAKQLQIGRAHV